MSLRSSSTPVKANNRLGNDSNDLVPGVPLFNAFKQAELGLSKDAQHPFLAHSRAELGLSKDARHPFLAHSRAELGLSKDAQHPLFAHLRAEPGLSEEARQTLMSSMTSPKASAPPYGDSLEGTNVFASSNKGSKIRSSFNNLINKITNPVASKSAMESTIPLNRTKRQVDLDNVVKLILDELKSDQVETLKYSPSDYDGLLQRQKARMTKLLQDLGSDAIVDLPDVRAQVSDNLGSTRSYNALFDMVLRAKSHGAFYQFKGKSLTSFTLFISDCMTAIRQLAITDDEIPMLDRIAGRHIDYLIPRDSKIAHARHIAVERKSDATKGHKQYDFTLSEILNDIKLVLESQGMNRLEQFNARPPMENAMDVSTFAKKFN
uniref:TF_AP-2 domain-containing protein n=1 Tax=Strongyloides papillosus TaxID=174720 RepID=A0A0N5BJ96_STREA